MTPDDPAHADSPDRALPGASPAEVPDRGSRGRSTVTVLAVLFAAAGFLALAAILLTAFLGQDVWPGLVLITYVCLPVSFLLMISLVVSSFVSRRRA